MHGLGHEKKWRPPTEIYSEACRRVRHSCRGRWSRQRTMGGDLEPTIRSMLSSKMDNDRRKTMENLSKYMWFDHQNGIYLSIYLPICLPVCLSIYLPICLSIYQVLYLFIFCIFLCIHVSMYLCIYLSILFIY